MNAADPFGLVGQVLDGQFRVDQMVGEGGFSVVYRGHHQGLNEPIAIKCLKLPAALGTTLVDSFVQRFRDESRILYRLSQGNLHVVRSIAAGTTQAPATGALVPYMVLEWLDGRSVQSDFMVRRSVGENGRSIDEIVKLFGTAADGLAFAHSQGVAHRDLNPGNLFLANTQQGLKMKVLDFGVAKLMHDGALNMGPRSHTVGHIRIFAPAYGAPEQFDDRFGTVGAHSDVYAFALILLEAMRDRSVVEGTNLGEFAQAACDAQRRPTPRALGLQVSDEVEQAFARATALDPAQRWHSAGDFWQSLTIATKLASERKHEDAARETPPLAMSGAAPGRTGGSQPGLKAVVPAPGIAAPKPAAGGSGKPLARTMPLGSDMSALPRPAPGASRPRIPTTIGIPMPGTASAPRPPAAGPATPLAPPVAPPRPASVRPPGSSSSPRMPAVPHLPPAAGMPAIPRPTTDRPPAAQSPAQAASPAPSTYDEDDADEATKVHAPAPEILQTLALHDVVAARNAAAEARVAEVAAQRAQPAQVDAFDDISSLSAAARAGAMPLGDMHGGRRAPVTPVPPSLGGGTMMMAPGAQNAAAAAQAAVRAAAANAAHAQQPPQVAPPPPPSDPHAPGLDSTLAMMSPVTSPYAQGPHAQQQQGMPGMPPPYGQGSSVVSQQQHAQHAQQGQGSSPSQPPPPMQQGQASLHPQGYPQHAQQQQPHPSHFSSPQTGGQPFAPQSFAQPSASVSGPKSQVPIVPIAIGLGVLALGGIGLGVFALRSRHAVPPPDPVAMSASQVEPVPVPVPVAADPPPVVTAAPEAVPAAAAIVEEDAAPAAPASAAPAASAPSPPSAPTAATTALTGNVPQLVPGPAVPTPAPKPSADPNAFNEGAARTRLSQANGVLVICHKEGGVSGAGTALVTFATDGSVAGVLVQPPYAGTKEGECASKQFQRAKISAFTGDPKTIKHSFEVP